MADLASASPSNDPCGSDGPMLVEVPADRSVVKLISPGYTTDGDPSYPSNLDCVWQVSAPDGMASLYWML